MINFVIDNIIWIWLFVFLIMVILEFITVEFVTIWFAASAIPTLIVAAFLPEQLIFQILLFLVFGVVLMVLTRPALIKYFKKNVIHTNVDSYVGKTAIVTKEITPIHRGFVLFEKDIWTAISNETIEVDSEVKILAIEGNKFVVSKID